MNSLGIWTIVMIIYQTAICVIISWLTLTCRLAPDSNELHEVTLMKLLYLYDPEACGRIHFYNFTVRNYDDLLFSTIMWPVSNPIAAQFRRAIRLWLSLHIIWLAFSIVNVTHGRRPCGFYAVLVPFTITGLAMLVVDVVFMAMFLQDTAECNTENIFKPILLTFDNLITFNRYMWSLVSWPALSLIALPQNGVVITCVAILDYMNRGGRSLRWIIKVYPWHTVEELQHATLEDTSWIPLLFAFTSCRGIVQWIINLWLIKDNYFAGLGFYRQLQKEAYRSRARLKE